MNKNIIDRGLPYSLIIASLYERLQACSESGTIEESMITIVSLVVLIALNERTYRKAKKEK